MKRSNYLLKVESPCSENWAAMTPTDSGRFCASCAKNVTDFTNLSDDQVLAILKKSNGNLCGRLQESQVNRYLMSKSEPSNKSGLYKLFAGLFMLTATNRSLAKSGMDRKAAIEQRQELLFESKGFRVIESSRNLADSSRSVFKGRVVDSLSQNPLHGVLITLKGADIQTVTDQNGTFELTIPLDFLKKENTFVFSFIGFEGRMITANSSDFPVKKNIALSADSQLNEVVMVGGYKVHKRKWWQFWRKKYCE